MFILIQKIQTKHQNNHTMFLVHLVHPELQAKSFMFIHQELIHITCRLEEDQINLQKQLNLLDHLVDPVNLDKLLLSTPIHNTLINQLEFLVHPDLREHLERLSTCSRLELLLKEMVHKTVQMLEVNNQTVHQFTVVHQHQPNIFLVHPDAQVNRVRSSTSTKNLRI